MKLMFGPDKDITPMYVLVDFLVRLSLASAAVGLGSFASWLALGRPFAALEFFLYLVSATIASYVVLFLGRALMRAFTKPQE